MKNSKKLAALTSILIASISLTGCNDENPTKNANSSDYQPHRDISFCVGVLTKADQLTNHKISLLEMRDDYQRIIYETYKEKDLSDLMITSKSGAMQNRVDEILATEGNEAAVKYIQNEVLECARLRDKYPDELSEIANKDYQINPEDDALSDASEEKNRDEFCEKSTNVFMKMTQVRDNGKAANEVVNKIDESENEIGLTSAFLARYGVYLAYVKHPTMTPEEIRSQSLTSCEMVGADKYLENIKLEYQNFFNEASKQILN